MIHEDVAYHDLERVLAQMGFVPSDARSPLAKYHVFTHQPTDTIVMLPYYKDDDNVSPAHLISIRRVVSERGVIEPDVFDRLLASA